jgi:uncharacterized protein YkwD
VSRASLVVALAAAAACVMGPGATTAAARADLNGTRTRAAQGGPHGSIAHSRGPAREPSPRRSCERAPGEGDGAASPRLSGRCVVAHPRARDQLSRTLRRMPHVLSLPSQTGLEQATLARVLSLPCQNEHLVPEPSNLTLVRAAVLCLINRERAQNGELPLAPDAQLEAAAQAHAQEMIATDYFEHVSPSGETPVDRARAAGYVEPPPAGYIIGENLAWGTFSLATPQAIVAAWLASPGHLANILESQYCDTGIAVVAQVPADFGDDAPGATYAQEFGVITH